MTQTQQIKQAYQAKLDAINIVRDAMRGMDSKDVATFLQLMRIQNYIIQPARYER